MATMNERVALVTGAGRGIGAEIAARFAREGAAVGVVDLDPESAERSANTINRAGGLAIGPGDDGVVVVRGENPEILGGDGRRCELRRSGRRRGT